MIKRQFIAILLEVMRHAARGIFLATGIFIALFACWFVFRFLSHLKQWLDATVFDQPWT